MYGVKYIDLVSLAPSPGLTINTKLALLDHAEEAKYVCFKLNKLFHLFLETKYVVWCGGSGVCVCVCVCGCVCGGGGGGGVVDMCCYASACLSCTLVWVWNLIRACLTLSHPAFSYRFSGVCVSMFIQKILSGFSGKRVTVIEGGKGSTQISTIQL